MQTLTVTVISAISVIGAVIACPTAVSAGAGGPPELDVRPSCRASDRALLYAGTDKPRADAQACLDDERTARNDLAKAWASFSSIARTQCVGMNRTGGSPSYVELLTCLEVMRDAAKIQ